MKNYILIFNNLFATRLDAIEIVKKIPEITSWRSDMPNAIYLKSDSTAQQLCDAIREVRDKGRFLVCEIGDNRQGYLTKDSWRFLSNTDITT
jgi:hypothetical protein